MVTRQRHILNRLRPQTLIMNRTIRVIQIIINIIVINHEVRATEHHHRVRIQRTVHLRITQREVRRTRLTLNGCVTCVPP